MARKKQTRDEERTELLDLIADDLTEWERESGSRDAAFRDWATKQILWDDNLSDDQVRQATLIDGSNDAGIDGWHYGEDAEPPTLHLIQSKDQKLDRGDLDKLPERIYLTVGDGIRSAATEARVLVSEFTRRIQPDTRVHFHLVTSHFATQPLRTHAEHLSSPVDLPEAQLPALFTIHDLRDLTEELKVIAPAQIEAEFALPDAAFFETWQGGYKTIAFAAEGVELSHIFRKNRTHLFRLNPRYYLSNRGSINKSTRLLLTLSSPTQMIVSRAQDIFDIRW